MKLELKNIKRNDRLSEETHCYSAVLYLDSKAIADVGNRGHGGPDEVHARPGCAEALAQAEAWCKSLPPLPSEYSADGLAMDLELWCGMRVDDHMVLQDMRKAMKKSILVLEDGKVFSYGFKGVKAITPQHVTLFRNKHPAKTMLNDMAEDVAFAAFKAATGV